MKMILITFLVSFSSCSVTSKVEGKTKFIQMHELWKMKASLNDVKKTFGTNFKDVDSGLTYSFPNSKFPEMGFFFDNSHNLREQFAFLDEGALQILKKELHCEWKETEEVKDIAHYQRTIKKGSCPNLSISYETYLDLNAYEVRWKR